MTLEQRVEALEMAITNMAAQLRTSEEMSGIMRRVASDATANTSRLGGVLNAAQKQAAKYEAGINISII